MQDNQTNLCFECMPPAVEDYLFLQEDNEDIELSSSDKNEEEENLI